MILANDGRMCSLARQELTRRRIFAAASTPNKLLDTLARALKPRTCLGLLALPERIID